MRRVAFAIVGTIAGLVGLLSFKTHSACSQRTRRRQSGSTPGAEHIRPATPNTGSAPSPRRRRSRLSRSNTVPASR